MNVVYNFFPFGPEQQTYGDELWVVEMIDVGILPNGFLVHVKAGACHPPQPRSATRNRFDTHVILFGFLPVGADHRDGKSRASEGTAFFVENSWIQGRVDRSHMHGFQLGHRPEALGIHANVVHTQCVTPFNN